MSISYAKTWYTSFFEIADISTIAENTVFFLKFCKNAKITL